MIIRGLDKNLFIERLTDTAKLIAESEHRQTISRRAYIIPLFPIHIQDALKKTVPDQNLFGSTGLVKQFKETETLFELLNAKETSSQVRLSGNYKGPFERRPLSNLQGSSGAEPANRQRLFFRGARTRPQQRGKFQNQFRAQAPGRSFNKSQNFNK